MSLPEPVAAQTDRLCRIKAVLRVATGNFLEMYDFTVFGYYAAAIGRTFFPKSSEFASLMLSFATFGVCSRTECLSVRGRRRLALQPGRPESSILASIVR